MFIGLILSGIIALIFSSSQSLSSYLFSNPFLLFFLIIIELILVFAISGIIKRLSSKTALILFLIYSVIDGVVLSSIFLVYTASSIAFTFFAVSSMFAVLAIYGFYTELDLSSFGPVLFGALIALIITSIANFFLK
jgi:FtsH-binding integral membrane protein